MFLWALILLNLFLFFRLIWSDQGILAYMDLRGRHEALATEFRAAEKRSQDLSREITRLKSDPDHQQDMIRERMNFVKDGEILYVFPDKAADKGKEARDVEEN